MGRWLTSDPYGQYTSPYLGMGNNPINGIDPDGGWSSRFARFIAWAGNGFQGKFVNTGREGDSAFGLAIDIQGTQGSSLAFSKKTASSYK